MFLNKSSKSKFGQYQDPTGEFSNRALETATWYVRNKYHLERIGTGLLVAWCVGSIGFGLWGWGKYLLFDLRADRLLLERQVAEVPNYAALQSHYRALPLKVTNVEVFPSAKERYTLAADVTNPNKAWVAYVTYRFSYAGGETPSMKAAVLPGATRPLLAFSPSTRTAPVAPKFEMQDIAWRRINPHAVPDVPGYLSARLGFVVEDVVTRSTSTLAAALGTTPVSFTLINATAYSYWDPEFAVELFQGNDRAGILTVTVPEFHSGERRTIDVRSFVPIPGVSDIEVIPLVDIFNKAVYIEPGNS